MVWDNQQAFLKKALKTEERKERRKEEGKERKEAI